MTIVKNQLPKELVRVEEIYQESLTSNDPRMVATSFIVELGNAVRTHISSGETNVQLALVTNWLRHHMYCLEQRELPELTAVAMDYCISLLLRNKALPLFTVTVEQRHLLASLTVRRAYLHKHGMPYQQEINMTHLLRTWTNKDLPNVDTYRPEDVVRLLYGDACWELLGVDVEWEVELPRVMWKNKPPLVWDKVAMEEVTLPEDIAA